MLTIATDGVWDNWKLSDYNVEMTSDANAALVQGAADSQSVSDKFMKRNLEIAYGNFGAQADNMTIVTCFIQPNGSEVR